MEKISHYLLLKCVAIATSQTIRPRNAIKRVGDEEEIYRIFRKCWLRFRIQRVFRHPVPVIVVGGYDWNGGYLWALV